MPDEVLHAAERVFETVLGVDGRIGVVSTGLLARSPDGNLVFAVNKPADWRSEPMGLTAGLIGIGGKREPGETVLECLHRECREETGCRIRVDDSARTYCLHKENLTPVTLNLNGEPRPFLITLLSPVSPRASRTLILSYAGEILDTPTAEDIGAIAFVPDEALLALASTPRSVAELEQMSARFYARAPLPPSLLLRPLGTVAAFLNGCCVPGNTNDRRRGHSCA